MAREAGLPIKWDGSLDTRMEVHGFDTAEFEDFQEREESEEESDEDEGDGQESDASEQKAEP